MIQFFKFFTNIFSLCYQLYQEKEFEDTNGTDRNRKSEDRQDHGQQNETKDKHRTHNTTLKTKAGVTRTLQKPG